jgi:hypothetical protein
VLRGGAKVFSRASGGVGRAFLANARPMLVARSNLQSPKQSNLQRPLAVAASSLPATRCLASPVGSMACRQPPRLGVVVAATAA